MTTNTKRKDLTRDEAKALAKAKWGAEGYTAQNSRPRRKACVVGRSVHVVGHPVRYDAFTGPSWREACEKAGLLPLQAKARELEGGK